FAAVYIMIKFYRTIPITCNWTNCCRMGLMIVIISASHGIMFAASIFNIEHFTFSPTTKTMHKNDWIVVTVFWCISACFSISGDRRNQQGDNQNSNKRKKSSIQQMYSLH